MAEPRELRVPVHHGELSALFWSSEKNGSNKPCILALHGWLDNAASFQRMAPLLAEWADVLAIDMRGHGRSDHLPPGCDYQLSGYIQDLDAVLHWLRSDASEEWAFSCNSGNSDSGQRKLLLLGHSLGGVISLMYAAAAPEQIDALITIEALGPYSGVAEESVSQMKKLLDSKRAAALRDRKLPVYNDIADVCRARMSGFGGLAEDAAELLVRRAMRPVDDGWTWRSDSRLRAPTAVRLTEAQTLDFIRRQSVPCLLIAGREGFIKLDSTGNERLAALKAALADPLENGRPRFKSASVDGRHHAHMDGDYVSMARLIGEFYDDLISECAA